MIFIEPFKYDLVVRMYYSSNSFSYLAYEFRLLTRLQWFSLFLHSSVVFCIDVNVFEGFCFSTLKHQSAWGEVACVSFVHMITTTLSA